MITREIIKGEIDRIPDKYLEILYKIIKGFEESEKTETDKSFMTKLKEIKIQGPVDFAKNVDLYMTGEKEC